MSILIPAYNAEKWLPDTLRSALAQTWAPKEIVVVDDGSTDRTLEVARQFESESVRIFSQKNQGGSAARNKAFSLSRGDYIQWLDHDDVLAPDKIERQMQVADSVSRRTLLSGCWGKFSYQPRRAKFVPSALWCDLSPTEFLMRKMGQNVFMQTGVWLVSRELTEAAGPWDTSMLTDDDGEYLCRVLLASEGIRFVPEAKAYWRIMGRGQGSYIGHSDRKLEAKSRAIQLHIRYLRSLEDSERTRAACIKYLQTDLIYFYPLRPDIVEQFHRTAKDLGGQLEVPRLPWKYSWIKTILGWNWAQRARLLLPQIKWSVVRKWEWALFHIENLNVGG